MDFPVSHKSKRNDTQPDLPARILGPGADRDQLVFRTLPERIARGSGKPDR